MDLEGLSNAHDFFSGFVSTFLIYGYIAFVAVRGAGGPMMNMRLQVPLDEQC